MPEEDHRLLFIAITDINMSGAVEVKMIVL